MRVTLMTLSMIPILLTRGSGQGVKAENEVPTWNRYEQEESNWLIKPQHQA